MTDAHRRTVRTALQSLLGLLAALPLLVNAGSLPHTLPGLGLALAVSAAVTRVMAVPALQQALPGWLRTTQAPSQQPTQQPGQEPPR